MEELNTINKIQHKLIMVNRKNCALTGIVDVIAFDEKEVILETQMGMLLIKGENLHIKRLTLEHGEVDVDGTIDSYIYSGKKDVAERSQSFFARLFK